MNQTQIFNQYDLIRGFTLNIAKNTPAEMADIVPNGFNNNIRWNIGHILASQEGLLFGGGNPQSNIPESYRALFGPGSKPADWSGDVPSLETLASQLAEQTGRIKEAFGNRLEEALPQPFTLRSGAQVSTYGEMLMFTLYHEGMHTGYISALKRAIESQSK